jgi:hypothetical protein
MSLNNFPLDSETLKAATESDPAIVDAILFEVLLFHLCYGFIKVSRISHSTDCAMRL